MQDETSPEKSPWGWKAVVIAFILSAFFLGFFWLAVTNEPDYMPSQQNKHNTQQQAFKTAPAMDPAALEEAVRQKQAKEASSAQAHQMSEQEHAQMDQHGH